MGIEIRYTFKYTLLRELKMNKWLYYVIILLAVVCVCLVVLNMRTATKSSSEAIELERSQKVMDDLKEQILKAESQKNSANLKVGELQQEISALTEQRNSDRLIIQDLWKMLLHNTRATKEHVQDQEKTVKQDQEQTVQGAEEELIEYDAELVRELIESGGSLESAIRQIVTSKGIASTLKAHNGQPAYWAAAASLAHDPEAALEYLTEAADLYPGSEVVLSSLVEANIAHGTIDESLLAYIDEMKIIDPANALADCYAAYSQFNTGDIEGALQSLSQAGAKDRFADDRMDLMMARYDYFLDGGASDSMAIGLSAFDLPLSHMSIMRSMGNSAMEQVSALSVAGQYDEALQIAQNVSNIGRSLSSSGRFLVYDRVGMAMQQAALEQQRQIHEAHGDVSQIQKIDVQLQAIDERSSMIDVMAQTFGGVMQNMTDQDIADYVDAIILNGEFSTLQDIPEIAEALAQTSQEQSDQTIESQTP
jgi:tetratricopeptide (TPR) repeat protein